MNEFVIERAGRLRKLISEHGADAFIIIADEGVNWESLYYMSGFRGTSGSVVIYDDSAELILDRRYIQQGRTESPHDVIEQQHDLIEDVRRSLLKHCAKTVCCEAKKTLHSTWSRLSGSADAGLKDGTELIEMLRRTKDEHEIDHIRKAGKIGANAFLETLNDVRPGITEREFEAALNYHINKYGGETGFDMIVASGQRSAMPHGRASDKVVNKGEWVTVDFGARYSGYLCDITRNFSIGEPDIKAAEYHNILLEAHAGASDKLCAGASCADIHNTAADILEGYGVGKYFTHSVGHGFGLEIHEPPILSSRRCDILVPGDVVTIEPGIYIEGWGGLRIEDDYLVTENGSCRLTDQLNQYFYRV